MIPADQLLFCYDQSKHGIYVNFPHPSLKAQVPYMFL